MDDFGGKLRQARERRGISLRQIAASTKISAAALEALERNDISKLPGGIFSRAFVRSYAVEVGLDPDETVREFLDRFNQETPPTAESVAATIPEQEREFEEQRRRAGMIVKAVLVSIPLLLIILYLALRGRGGTQAQEPEAEPPVAAAPAAGAPPSAARADLPADTGAASVVTGQISLQIHPIAECWVSLRVDGQEVLRRIMRAGERETRAVAREAVVEVGNAGAFAYSINGRAGKPLGAEGQVRTLRLTPDTAAQYVR
jgi:cytoskeletal protein RodZ